MQKEGFFKAEEGRKNIPSKHVGQFMLETDRTWEKISAFHGDWELQSSGAAWELGGAGMSSVVELGLS